MCMRELAPGPDTEDLLSLTGAPGPVFLKYIVEEDGFPDEDVDL